MAVNGGFRSDLSITHETDAYQRINENGGKWVRDLTLLEALTGGAFDRLNWHIVGHLTVIFQKSQMPGGLPGGGREGRFWN